jgi:hypothetical protein
MYRIACPPLVRISCHQFLIFGLCIAGWNVAWAEPPSAGAEGQLRVYFIGNSLTRGLSPQRLAGLFEERGMQLTFGSQLAAAVPLSAHLARRHHVSGDVFLRMNHLESHPFGPFDRAMGENMFDVLVIQPHMDWLDPIPQPRHDFLIGDVAAAVGLIEYALGGNPAGRAAISRVFIYATWPAIHDGIVNGRTDLPDRPTYSDFWKAQYDPRQILPSRTVPSRDFFEQLRPRLDRHFQGRLPAVQLAPAGHVFAELDEAIRAGNLPGIAQYFEANADYYRNARATAVPAFPFNGFAPEWGVMNLYTDHIHLNSIPHNGPEDGTLGAYIASATLYAALTGRSPVGLSTTGYARLDPQRDAGLIAAVQETIWQVVQPQLVRPLSPHPLSD